MQVHLIAIVGGSGSGKTWLARRLARRLGPLAGRVSLDSFYRDLTPLPPRERVGYNFDHPAAIEWDLVEDALFRIREGKAVALPAYDYSTHTRRCRARRWRPRPVVLVDGLWLLRRARLRALYTLSVYVVCPEPLRRARRLERDERERDRRRAAIVRQYERQVAPMHRRYVAPQASLADRIVGSPAPRAAVERLAAELFAAVRRPCG